MGAGQIPQPALLGDEEDMQEIAAALGKIQKFAKELRLTALALPGLCTAAFEYLFFVSFYFLYTSTG